jgi:hypothetical protein
VVDHFHLVRGANSVLDSVRPERQREHSRRRPKGARRSGKGASWRQDLTTPATACSKRASGSQSATGVGWSRCWSASR